MKVDTPSDVMKLHCFVNEVTRRYTNIFIFESWAFEAEKRIVQDFKNNNLSIEEKIDYYSHPLDVRGIKLFIRYLSKEAVRELIRLFPGESGADNKNAKTAKEYNSSLLDALRVVKTIAREASERRVWISSSDAESILDDVLGSASLPKARVTLEASLQ